MKSIFKISFVIGALVSLTSCKDDSAPNYQYMPNMYESVAYETYSESTAFNSPNGLQGKEGQLPPVGTIKRGYVPYEYPNTPEGYAAAKLNSKSPLDPTTIDMKKAEELFNIYCAICHGTAGDGKGNLVKQGKFLGVPNYKDREITEGSVNHVINFGLNSMGSYANQLNQQERWMVAAYVMKLRSQL
ncbi:c-type cytochrome [Flavobacterium aciduliphilum]|jgi:mono/diheme cytochrome c family protein|uniref:Quinol:cytochrome c oxidoreductase monoheme cytochrome subunit n=1 Tax=Flavobacterium aciduliphilum TaxID=1101402 RepID=A0A328YI96_9FLAO|nr:cytochrome c [Flavobacterium aciduliphilum]RAR71722.1 quinol:cytochrome c oxidoreductase monoheme cytochrome subunit [Flavobacterium aciduliphilum]